MYEDTKTCQDICMLRHFEDVLRYWIDMLRYWKLRYLEDMLRLDDMSRYRYLEDMLRHFGRHVKLEEDMSRFERCVKIYQDNRRHCALLATHSGKRRKKEGLEPRMSGVTMSRLGRLHLTAD